MEKANEANGETEYKYRIELAGHGSEDIADGSRYSDTESLENKETLSYVSKAEVMKELPVLIRVIAKLLCLFEKDSHPIKKLHKYLAITTIFVNGILAFLSLDFSSDGKSVTTNIRLGNISTCICFCIYGPISIISVQKYFNDSVGRARVLNSWRSISIAARQQAGSYTSRSFWGWFVFH